MKRYPSIGKKIQSNDTVVVFDKLDGSNVRAEWSPKKGFHKFGRRRGLLDDSNPILKRSVRLIQDKYGAALNQVFRAQRWRRVTAFFEFYGPSSFAGWHDEGEEQTVTLLDVDVFQKGLLPASEFLNLFDHVDIPRVLHRGRVGPSLATQVREGSLEGVTFEGVVCKGVSKKGKPTMFKVKSHAWLSRLREQCNGDASLFEKMS